MTKTVVLFLLLSGFASGQHNTLTPQERGNGWRVLSDGSSLEGCSSQGSASWHSEGGVLSGTGEDRWLRSNAQYSDFDWTVNFHNSPNWNSVFVRATQKTKDSERSLQIYNEDPKYATGSIEDYIQVAAKVSPATKERHSFIAQVRGEHMTVLLNGQRVLDGKDPCFHSATSAFSLYKGWMLSSAIARSDQPEAAK